LDQKYNFTQGLLGDFYMHVATTATDNTTKLEALQKAEDYYTTAAAVTKYTDSNSKASYLVSLSNVYLQKAIMDPNNVDRGMIQQAIDVLEQSIASGLSAKDLWKVQETLAKLYYQLGDKANAQYYAKAALAGAPDSATTRIQTLITQTESLP
jgi:tetratricopeptide (TPR) repeat protein